MFHNVTIVTEKHYYERLESLTSRSQVKHFNTESLR